MAAQYPPPPPPPPSPPPRSNDALLAVVIGVVIVIACMAAFGIFAVHRFVINTHVTESGRGAQHQVEIQSPLGDLKVNGDDNNAKVDIQSPFGDVKVNTTPNPAALNLAIYPGAELVTSRDHSAFRDHHGFDDLDELNIDQRDGGATGVQVQISAGDKTVGVNVAEFRTSATPEQVLSFYNDLLEKYGPVQRREHNGATSLEVRLAHDNVRAAAVKPGYDGTHFVLVRVASDSAK